MKKALIIGINNYSTAPLKGCINDATAIASVLERNGDGSPNFDVKLVTDVPTKGNLKALIKSLFEGNNDTALLYFSGHGFLNEVGGYIVTPDATTNDEGVSMDEILTIANNSKTKDKIIILDCCHAGAMGSPAIASNAMAQLIEGVTILTASKASEVAMEVNGHGVFTNLLIDALHGGAADLRGHITPGSVYAYIDQALGTWDQRPVFKTNVTRFTSLRQITPSVPLETLRKIIDYFPLAQQEHALDPSYEFSNTGIAEPAKVAIFKDLQKFESVNLVTPVGEEHMYYAAMNSKSCKLTALGYHYWRLVKEKRI